jgi:cytochrome c5
MKFRLCLAAFVLLWSPAGVIADRLEDGQEIYNQACARCHDSGLEGAPVTGQTRDWDDRSDLWEAVLFEHAEKGYTTMPARGGDSRLSEYEVNAAAEYMLTTSHPKLPSD